MSLKKLKIIANGSCVGRPDECHCGSFTPFKASPILDNKNAAMPLRSTSPSSIINSRVHPLNDSKTPAVDPSLKITRIRPD
ncbi:unnamed protein product [Adineta steineri]|uniref:Uncharacterized protein n=1 Tax=Adineta steineri TaxID=433720 RepID=A0A819U791_9BILA|nr:unnamed protein product [Adineta steineri]CAF4084448.1 unnamed protein product [Adineta steineri]